MSAIRKFRQLCSFESLKDIAASLCRRGIAGIDGVKGGKFLEQVDGHVRRILESLDRGDHNFSPYREKLILKGAGHAPRVISIPTIKDAIVLKILKEALTRAFPKGKTPPPFRVVESAISKFKSGEFNAYVRIDIKDFYPSIPHNALYGMLRKKIRCAKMLGLVMQAIGTPTTPMGKKPANPLSEKGVPQGLSISNILANIYMLELDRQWGARKDCAYIRYVDDILILCASGQEEKILEEIGESMRQLNLEIHPRGGGKTKTGKIFRGMKAKDEISYLGYTLRVANSGKVIVGVRAAAMRKMRQSIIDILTVYRHTRKKNIRHLEWCLNLRITGCHFREQWFGWVHYYSQANIAVAWTLDEFVKEALTASRFGISQHERSKIKVKSFVRSMRKGRKGGSPNFDEYSVEEMKDVLNKVFPGTSKHLENPSDEEIRRLFSSKIFRHVKQLQRDMNPDGEDGEGRSGG